MRVCLLTRFFPPKVKGGGELGAYYVAHALSKQNIHMHVVTSKVEGIRNSMGNSTTVKKLHVHRILSNNRSKNLFFKELFYNFLFSIKNAYKLISFLKKNKIDLIQIYNMDTLLEGILAGKIMNIPVIVYANSNWTTCFHGNHILPPFRKRVICHTCTFQNLSKCVMYLYFPPRVSDLVKYFLTPIFLFKIKIRRKLIEFSDKIISISNCVKEILAENGVPKEKIEVIQEDFFNPESYQNVKKDIFKQLIPSFPNKKTILFVGRLKISKGIELFVKTAHSLINNGVDATFVIVGRGPLLNSMQNLVHTLKLNKQIFFISDYLPDKLMPSVYSAADMVVAPIIREEALGRVMIESMAANSPVIATKACGILDIVIDQVNGLLVKPNIKEISEAIMVLLNDNSLRKEMGQRGRRYVTKRFSESTIVPKIIRSYKEISNKSQ